MFILCVSAYSSNVCFESFEMGNDNIVSGDGNINFPHLLNNEVA